MTGNSTLRAFNQKVSEMLDASCVPSWQKINALMSQYGASGDVDYNRMRYDAIWMMKESLVSGDPLTVDSLLYAFECLESYYETDALERFVQLSAHNDSLADAERRVQYRAEKNCREKNLRREFVTFERLCRDIKILERQEEAKPYIQDLCIIRTLKDVIIQDKADYMHMRNMIDDFIEWCASDEFTEIISAYEALIKPSTITYTDIGLRFS